MNRSVDDEAGPADRALSRAIGLAAAAIFGALAVPMLRGQVYVDDDLRKYHLPLRAFYAGCLARGDRFEWCPSLYCGFDLQGEGQVGMFHPLHLMLYGLLPLTAAFDLELLANYVAAFAGMALFLRRWRLPRGAALFGALAYSASGFYAMRYMFLNFLAVASHIPWLLLAIDVLIRDEAAPRRAWAAAAVAFLTASQLLLGYPQSVWQSLLAEAIYAAWIGSRSGSLRRLAPWAGAKALGVLMGGIQLLPTWEALADSVRAEPTPEFLAHGSLHPANLIQMVSPYLFKDRFFTRQPPATIGAHEMGMYAGAAVPVLLAWLLIRRKDLGRLAPLALAAAWIGAIALALSFGRHNPLFAYYIGLPILSKFRVSARYIALVHLATALLSAIALADLGLRAGAGPGRPSWRRLWPLTGPLAISLVVSVGSKWLARARPDFALAPFLAPMELALAGPALVATATLLAVAAARGRRSALIGLVLFAAADQAVYGLTFLRRDPPRDLASLLQTRPLPAGARGGRIMVPEGDDLWIMNGASLVEGYTALKPRRRLHYQDPLSLRVAGARWLLEGSPPGRWVPLADPLPRVRLVTRAVKRMFVGGAVRPDELATTAFVPVALDLPGGAPGTAAIVGDRPGRITIATEAASRQFLILAEGYHEGWHLRIDGREQPTVRVDGDFLGCVVERGTHRVAFQFRSRGFQYGAYLSCLGLLLATGLLATLLGRRRRVLGFAARGDYNGAGRDEGPGRAGLLDGGDAGSVGEMQRLEVLCFAGTYGLALLSELARFVTRSAARWYLTVGLTVLGWLVQTAYLANLGWSQNKLPVTSAFESLLVLSWIFALIGLYLMVHSPRPVAVGLFVLPLVLALVVVAGGFASRAVPLGQWGGARAFWGATHGIFLLAGAVSSCVAFAAGLMYLVQASRLKHKRRPRFGFALPSLEQSERLNRGAITLAFPLLTFGLSIGVILDLAARRGPEGPPLSWTDPKVVSAALMWLVFAMLLHARFRPAMRGRSVMLLTIVAFAFLVFTWVGVDVLKLPTAHGAARAPGRAS